jgi:hypothetical protein
VLDAFLAASLFDQDPAHGFGSRGEEMGAAVPLRLGPFADEPEIGRVHQVRRLEGLPRALAREPLGGQSAQFLIDKRQELLGCLLVAPLDRREDVRDVVHRSQSSKGSNPAKSPGRARARMLQISNCES